MVNLPQEDLDAVAAGNEAQAAKAEFILEINENNDQPYRRDERGDLLLTKYGIPADQWKTWATAAGLPDAKWDDQTAATQVATWAANYLYDMFNGDWGMMAIGWRYGAGVARQIRELYGKTPTGATLMGILGEGGAAVIEAIIYKFNDVPPPPDPSSRYPSRMAQGGDVSLTFVPEEGELFDPTSRDTQDANPVHTILGKILSQMADKNSVGGVRSSIEDVEVQQVPDDDETMSGPSPVQMTEAEV